jgi:hypothetical protein
MKHFIRCLLVGAFIGLVAVGAYHLTGWVLVEHDDHERGLSQGMIIMFVFAEGARITLPYLKKWNKEK